MVRVRYLGLYLLMKRGIGHSFSWDVGINFKLTDDALVYFDVSRGTREGRFNTASTTQDGFGSVDPEENLAFEVGLKSEFFDNRFKIKYRIYILIIYQTISNGRHLPVHLKVSFC